MRKEMAFNGSMGLLLVYKLIMDVLYLRYVHGLEAANVRWWDIFYDVNLNMLNYFFSWIVCTIILVVFRPTLQKSLAEYRFSEFILLMLLLVSVLPGLAMCGLGAFPFKYIGMFYLYWLLFFLLVRSFPSVKLKFPALLDRLSPYDKKRLLFVIGTVVACTLIFVFVYYGEGKFFVSGLQSSDVYTVRLKFRAISMPVLLNYVMANTAVVLLFLLMYFLKEQRYGYAAVVLFLQYIRFSCGADKIVFFSTMLCLMFYVLRKYMTANKIMGVAIGAAIATMGTWELWQNSSLLSFLVRICYLPNILGYYYFDFFQTHAPTMSRFWGETVMDSGKIAFAIGDLYFGNPECNANNGFLGDAFRLAGACGMVLHPILWSIYLFFLDKASETADWQIKIGTSIYWAFVMQNASITTSMLTHGGVAMIVLAYLCSETKKPIIVREQDISQGTSE